MLTSWPIPQPGLVVRYSYLWRRDALAGRDEGTKDRPCAVVVAVQSEAGRTLAYVLPITHRPPDPGSEVIEIPLATKKRLGLDQERSWVVVSEANVFEWPGPDLRFRPQQGPESAAYGFLPPGLFSAIRDRFLARARERRAGLVARTE